MLILVWIRRRYRTEFQGIELGKQRSPGYRAYRDVDGVSIKSRFRT